MTRQNSGHWAAEDLSRAPQVVQRDVSRELGSGQMRSVTRRAPVQRSTVALPCGPWGWRRERHSPVSKAPPQYHRDVGQARVERSGERDASGRLGGVLSDAHGGLVCAPVAVDPLEARRAAASGVSRAAASVLGERVAQTAAATRARLRQSGRIAPITTCSPDPGDGFRAGLALAGSPCGKAVGRRGSRRDVRPGTRRCGRPGRDETHAVVVGPVADGHIAEDPVADFPSSAARISQEGLLNTADRVAVEGHGRIVCGSLDPTLSRLARDIACDAVGAPWVTQYTESASPGVCAELTGVLGSGPRVRAGASGGLSWSASAAETIGVITSDKASPDLLTVDNCSFRPLQKTLRRDRHGLAAQDEPRAEPAGSTRQAAMGDTGPGCGTGCCGRRCD